MAEMAEIDMSVGAVETRLAEMDRLSAPLRRSGPIDMTAAAIERRLERVSELRRLCTLLALCQPGASAPTSRDLFSFETLHAGEVAADGRFAGQGS